jgi:hypothetical protein
VKLQLKKRLARGLWIQLLFFISIIAQETPLKSQNASCAADPTWLPKTPPPTFAGPPPAHPAPDCPFYQAAWQTFLYVTQNDSSGKPTFLSYATIEKAFGKGAASFKGFAPLRQGVLSLAPRTLQSPNGTPTVGAGPIQAGGLQGLLIDQEGRPIFYAIHMNQQFENFIQKNHLSSPSAVQTAKRDIQFDAGTVELKSAWMVVDPKHPPANYITTPASVPHLKVSNGKIVVDASAPPEPATVALLAIHVVFVLKGHPEMIWSSFEHIDANGQPDSAPIASDIPSKIIGDPVVSQKDYVLYKAGTSYSKTNIPASDADMAQSFDEVSQSFTKGGHLLQTSIIRSYPASKIKDINIDDDVASLNASMLKLFDSIGPMGKTDPRRNYQLVGAVWLDDPKTFGVGKKFANKPGQTSDDTGAMVAGEDRMSSTAMESFSQSENAENIQPGAFQANCFSCHNTENVFSDTGNNQKLLDAKEINISHIFSRYLLDQASKPPTPPVPIGAPTK